MICTALDRAGTRVVLTGGSAATVYAPEAYQSRDLDFVVFAGEPGAQAGAAMRELGFTVEGNHYVHPDNPLTVDFPKGPLAIGREILLHHDTLEDGELLLHILTPTDCCKDRLAWFMHYSDRSALEQALAVATVQRGQLDLAELRRWSDDEGGTDRFDEFLRRLGGP